MESFLVAGKAEEMTAVVHEFVDGMALQECGGSLLGSYEIDG
jgi:hypothetical protein